MLLVIIEFFAQQDQQKSNMQKEFNNAANGKGMDEREDFLQQIRTKVVAFSVLSIFFWFLFPHFANS